MLSAAKACRSQDGADDGRRPPSASEGCAMSSVAVKNPDTSAPGALDRLHLGILAGVVYLVGSVAIVFGLLPWLWYDLLGRSRSSAVDGTLLVLIGLAVAGG